MEVCSVGTSRKLYGADDEVRGGEAAGREHQEENMLDQSASRCSAAPGGGTLYRRSTGMGHGTRSTDVVPVKGSTDVVPVVRALKGSERLLNVLLEKFLLGPKRREVVQYQYSSTCFWTLDVLPLLSLVLDGLRSADWF